MEQTAELAVVKQAAQRREQAQGYILHSGGHAVGQQKFTAATGLSCTAPETGGITVTLTADENTNSVTCANTRSVPYWLDGDSFRINVFTKPQAQS